MTVKIARLGNRNEKLLKFQPRVDRALGDRVGRQKASKERPAVETNMSHT